MAFRALPDNPWWTIWLTQISGNITIPDQYSYHLDGETAAVDNDIQTTNATLCSLLQQYGLPDRQININEYANPSEQDSLWWCVVDISSRAIQCPWIARKLAWRKHTTRSHGQSLDEEKRPFQLHCDRLHRSRRLSGLQVLLSQHDRYT